MDIQTYFNLFMNNLVLGSEIGGDSNNNFLLILMGFSEINRCAIAHLHLEHPFVVL